MARIEPGLERRMQGNTGVTGGPLLPGGEVTTLTALVAAKDKEDKFFVKPRLHSSTTVSPLFPSSLPSYTPEEWIDSPHVSPRSATERVIICLDWESH